MNPGRNAPCSCGSGKKFKTCCLGSAPKFVPEPQKNIIDGASIIVLMPSRGKVATETVTALGHLDGHHSVIIPLPRKGVVDARNELARTALRVPGQVQWIPKHGFYCLWVDDDAFWAPSTVNRVLLALQGESVDIVCGWFSGRSESSAPKCFRSDGSFPHPGEDCNAGEVLEIARHGFHFVMHKLEVLEKVGADPFTPIEDEGEDFAFCRRAKAQGLRMWAHTGALVAHIDDDGSAYLPYSPKLTVVGSNLQRIENTRTYDGTLLQGEAK